MDIALDYEESTGYPSRPKVRLDSETVLPVILMNEPVKGVVHITLPEGKKLDHNGIKIHLIGVVEIPSDRQNGVMEMLSLEMELEAASTLSGTGTQYRFLFAPMTSQMCETYYGNLFRIRYFLKVVIHRTYAINISKEQEVAVQFLEEPPESNNLIQLEVGIEDCLHLEFRSSKSKYHLNDYVLGNIQFLLVRIKFKLMELAIVRKESIVIDTDKKIESETLATFEIMDGPPMKGDVIPVRLYLSPYALTPTYQSLLSKFSVHYFLNLILIDQEGRKYFKHQEMFLWRSKYG
nr:vacuolar protein sorting 26 putative [Albugo laibachii Nc14]|eukprot:CCA23710.1 vacuolar protein sorting 26 putative [Albugo laibachii Nc14]